MQFITLQPRQQTYFSTLEDQVSADNPVRLIDAFIDKLDLQKLGFTKTVHHKMVNASAVGGTLNSGIGIACSF